MFTKKAIDNTLGISRTDLRPYLWYNGIEPQIPTLGTYSPIITIKNFGKTPAFNFDVGWRVHFDNTFIINNLDLDIKDTTIGNPITPPCGENELRVSTKQNIIDKKLLDDIMNGRWFIFVYVEMRYTQHIGLNKIRHLTTFCIFYDVNKKGFMFYPRFNTDE
jgi:hypothetical protein